MSRLWLLVLFFSTSEVFSETYADNETLDANQHVIMFEKGVDSFMMGDYEKCDDYWLPLARAGDPMAARNMALLYHRGLGVPKDLEEAELFYRIAADKGVTAAQTMLGTLLIKGNEFKRNLSDAVKYLTAAYQAGDAIAAWNLGLLYENGIQVKKNLEKAMSLFQIAARGGHEPAVARISGKIQDGYAPPKAVLDAVNNSIDSDNKDSDKKFNERPEPVIPEDKTFEEKLKLDEEHDKKHFSDEIHFEKSLQSDEPNVALKQDMGEYKNVQVGIDKELDPFGVATSKKNRLDEVFNTESIGNNVNLTQANQHYTKGNYKDAKEIWETLFEEAIVDEAAYRLGKLYSEGKGVEKDVFRAYYYWKKGADAGGQKSIYILESFRSELDDKLLLRYEQEMLKYEDRLAD